MFCNSNGLHWKHGFSMNEMALFEERPVRRFFQDEEWRFVLTDIVNALTDSPAPSDYLKKLRRRDPSLAEAFKGGDNLSPLALPFETEGGRNNRRRDHNSPMPGLWE